MGVPMLALIVGGGRLQPARGRAPGAPRPEASGRPREGRSDDPARASRSGASRSVTARGSRHGPSTSRSGRARSSGSSGNREPGSRPSGVAVVRLLPEPGRVEAGAVRLGGRDLLALTEPEMRRLRGADVALIPQDPLSALNPAFRIGLQATDALRIHRGLSRRGGRRGDGPAPRPPRPFRAGGRAPALPPRAVGRDAAARPHRDGLLLRAHARDRRRADDGARRHHAGPDPAASRGAPGGAARGDALRHPRSRRGRAPGAPRRRDVRGVHRRVGADPGALPRSRASLHAGPPDAGAAGRRPHGGERRARGADAGPGGPAAAPAPSATGARSGWRSATSGCPCSGSWHPATRSPAISTEPRDGEPRDAATGTRRSSRPGISGRTSAAAAGSGRSGGSGPSTA